MPLVGARATNTTEAENTHKGHKVAQAVDRLRHSQRPNFAAAPARADTINLSKGDPGFATPDYICESAAEAMRHGYTHYPPGAGDLDLRTAIAEELSATGGGLFSPSDICITNGGTTGIYATMAAYLDPGDEVLLHDPSYSLYRDIALSLGAIPVMVPWNSRFHLDPDALEGAITRRTRMLVMDDPCNPTGAVLTPDEKRSVADIVGRHNLILLSDEAYDHLVYDGRPYVSAASFAELSANALITNTCSKRFAMTGWRIGYLAAREGLLEPASKLAQMIQGGVNYPSQRAAATAYTRQSDWQQRTLAEYTRRRDLMYQLVNNAPGLSCERPEGAFYAFVKTTGNWSSRDLVARGLEHGVAVRSGTEFGERGEGYVRLSFAGEPDSYAEGVARLADAAAK